MQNPKTVDEAHYQYFRAEYDEAMKKDVGYDALRWVEAELAFLELVEVEETESSDMLTEHKEILSVVEVMDLLSISRSTLDRRRKEGLPWSKTEKVIHFERAKVVEWVEGNRW